MTARAGLPICLLAAACAGHAPRPPEAPPATPAPPHQADPSFDWQALVVAPFGSTLKTIPVKLHEALLFSDEARGAGIGEDGECYAPDGPAPRFLGRSPGEYLLCFRQDRLSRIRASVRLEAAEAAALFAQACERWRKGAAPDAVPAAGPPARSCSGRSMGARFDAHLGAQADGAADAAAPDAPAAVDADEEAATVHMLIDGVPDA